MAFDLKVDKAPIAVDPDLTQTVKPQRPPPGTPTGGPNRHTTFVPSENTTFSLGEKAPTRINDVGITGRTDNHVHFHVQTNNTTVVSMGGPATEVTKFKSFDPLAPHSTKGYSMITEEVAYHDSKKFHHIVSRDDDVTIRAAKKNVNVRAGHGVDVQATGVVKITAHPGVSTHDDTWVHGVENAVGAFCKADYIKKSVGALDAARAGFALYVASVKNFKKPKEGKTGWEKADAWEKTKFVLDGAKLVSTLGRLASDTFTEQTGKVTVNGDDYVSITGGVAASMYGGLSASLSSALSASVYGTTASLTGFAFCSVFGGAEASMKSFRKTALGSDYGKIDIKAKTEISMSAETKTIVIGAKTNAQFTGDDNASVFSKTRAYFGSGGGSGYGVKATPKSLRYGKMTSADNCTSANLDNSWGVVIDDSQMEAKFKDTSFTMMKTKIKMKAKADFELESKSGKGIVKATKILLK
jgi:hypothetical protein